MIMTTIIVIIIVTIRDFSKFSGISRIRFSPFYESFRDSSINVWLKKICVFLSSNWGPLKVYVKLHPRNPLNKVPENYRITENKPTSVVRTMPFEKEVSSRESHAGKVRQTLHRCNVDGDCDFLRIGSKT